MKRMLDHFCNSEPFSSHSPPLGTLPCETVAVEIYGGQWVGLLNNVGTYIVYSCHPIAHLVSVQ